MKSLIRGGKVHDPAHDIDGVIGDVAIDGGRIIRPGPGWRPDRLLDASGCVVLPGGVDVHSHIAGASVSRGRRLLEAGLPPVVARGLGLRPPAPLVASTIVTGSRYASIGYTTAVEAAVAPSTARQCVLELADTPCVDSAFLCLLGNHALVLELLARGDGRLVPAVAREILARAGAYGIKVVNPAGVAAWRDDGKRLATLHEEGSAGVSPRQVLVALAHAAEMLRLPHPVHIHTVGLGLPGNVELTLETSRILTGTRHHLTHVQFHSYGVDSQGKMTSAAGRLMELFHRTPELTMDVGQVLFEEALTLSADLALEHVLWQLTGKRYASLEVELETGCGLVPLRYEPRSRIHALQWAIGLELCLLCRDPWRLALSTDHPNGGSFLSYPRILALLMSRDLRREALDTVGRERLTGSALPDLERELTLQEVAILTRAAPARILGLSHKGHLGAGADADVVVYDDLADRERMFRFPRWVLKGGTVVYEKGELRDAPAGTTHRAALSDSALSDSALSDSAQETSATIDAGEAARSPTLAEGRAELARWHRVWGSTALEQLGPDAVELAAMREVGA